jgi:hypothetical protein
MQINTAAVSVQSNPESETMFGENFLGIRVAPQSQNGFKKLSK